MEVLLRDILLRSLFWGFGFGMFLVPNANAQRITNIQASSDGQRVRVSYDLVGLTSRQLAKISLSFERDGRSTIEPEQVTGKTVLYESGQGNTLVWEADKEMAGLSAYLVPQIRLDVERYSYFELWQRRGDLVNKSFAKGMAANMLFPGLGWKYASGGTKGKGRAFLFGTLLASSVIAHQLARSSYQDYTSSLQEYDYRRANGFHHMSLGLGASASIFYLTSQFSFANKKFYFGQSPGLYE